MPVGRQDVEYVFKAQSAELTTALETFRAEIDALPNKKRITFEVKDKLLSEVARVKAELAAIPDEEVDIVAKDKATHVIQAIDTSLRRFFANNRNKQLSGPFPDDINTRPSAGHRRAPETPRY